MSYVNHKDCKDGLICPVWEKNPNVDESCKAKQTSEYLEWLNNPKGRAPEWDCPFYDGDL